MRATALDAAIGEWSDFHQMNGFYVQGVGRNTAVLPSGWETRLVAVSNANTAGATGYCLERHDLCLSKLAASREKDFAFVHSLLDADLVNLDVLAERAGAMGHAPSKTVDAINAWIDTQRATSPTAAPGAGRFASKSLPEADIKLSSNNDG